MAEMFQSEALLGQQILAARISVVADGKSGRETPAWIRELAARVVPAEPDVTVTPEMVAAAARIQVTADRKSSRKTEDWILKLARVSAP